jgi:hypothetical protein
MLSTVTQLFVSTTLKAGSWQSCVYPRKNQEKGQQLHDDTMSDASRSECLVQSAVEID